MEKNLSDMNEKMSIIREKTSIIGKKMSIIVTIGLPRINDPANG